MPQDRIEINGRTTTGDDRDGISLQDSPAAFLQSVDVIKSPTADMIEGALGGTVRMNTIRPLDLSGQTLAVSLDSEYADKTEEWAPLFNFSAGNLWDLDSGGSFGAMVMLNCQDRTIRPDEFKHRVRLYDADINGLVANTPSGKFAVRERGTLEQYVEDREQSSLNVTLQWAPPSDRGNFYLDLAMADRQGGQYGSSILEVGGSRVYNSNTTQDAGGQVNNFTLSGAFAIPKTWSEFRATETFPHAFGGAWDV